jgi:S1-C subfamily serine protease
MNDTTSRDEANPAAGRRRRLVLPALALVLALAVGLVAVAAVSAAGEIPQKVVMRVRPSVVKIETANSVGFGLEPSGSRIGTGFVVDAARGIVATSAHVVVSSPAQLRVTFHDGESTAARLLHHDAWHDFALVELERDADARWAATAVPLGDSFALHDQQELFLVGSNDGQEQSVKFGRVTNMVVNKGRRHSAVIQTSFDRTGGSSGSPVFDAAGRVVAVHTGGTDTTSFELRIEYVRDALRQLLESGRVRRGDVGLELDLIPVAEARRATRLPDSVARRIAAASVGRQQAIQVVYVLPGSPAAGRIRAGDVLVEVDGTLVAGDLYRVDRAVDARVGATVRVAVYRQGARLEHDLSVMDAERSKVARFVRFAGGVFHELTPELQRFIDFAGSGVFLSNATSGTPMGSIGSTFSDDVPNMRLTVVEEVDGTPTPDLDVFLSVAHRLEDGAKVQVIYRDFITLPKSQVARVTLDADFEELRAYRLDPAQRTWVEEPVTETIAAASGAAAGAVASAPSRE